MCLYIIESPPYSEDKSIYLNLSDDDVVVMKVRVAPGDQDEGLSREGGPSGSHEEEEEESKVSSFETKNRRNSTFPREV